MSESTYKHKPGSGSMFRNTDATPDNNQPLYRGSMVTPDGKKWEIAEWENVAQDSGKKYRSLSIQEPYVKPVKKEESKTEPVEEKKEAPKGLPF